MIIHFDLPKHLQPLTLLTLYDSAPNQNPAPDFVLEFSGSTNSQSFSLMLTITYNCKYTLRA